MNRKITHINNFSEIEILPNSLVVLDIDETILTFDYKSREFNTPIKLDSKNLDDFIKTCKKSGCKIILLTARLIRQHDETVRNLKDIEFRINPDNIFYNTKKGDKLLKIVMDKYQDIENIIFVDDLFSNVKDVESVFCFTQYKLNLYWIEHEAVNNYKV